MKTIPSFVVFSSFRFTFFFLSIGSIKKIWDVILDAMAIHLCAEGQKALFHYGSYFDRLDAAFIAGNAPEIARICQTFVGITQFVDPYFTDRVFNNELDENGKSFKNMLTVERMSFENRCDNATWLHKINSIVQPMSINHYYVSVTYKPTENHQISRK